MIFRTSPPVWRLLAVLLGMLHKVGRIRNCCGTVTLPQYVISRYEHSVQYSSPLFCLGRGAQWQSNHLSNLEAFASPNIFGLEFSIRHLIVCCRRQI